MSSTTDLATTAFRSSPGYKGDSVLALNAALIGCSTIIVGLRLYVRTFISKALGLDDLLASLAFVFLTVQSAFDIRSVNYGSGAHIQYVPQELIPKFFSSLVNNTLICFIGVGLMRLSIVAFLRRLAKDLNSLIFTRAVYMVGLVVIGQTLGCFFYRLTECTPISHIWLVPNPKLHCVTAHEEQNNLIVHQSIGVVLDLILFALPVWVIRTHMMKSAKRLQLIFVFSVGLFVVVAGIVRLVFMNTLLFLDDPTYSMSTLGPWTDLEGHTGLWVASFPALQPLLHKMTHALGFYTKNNSHQSDDSSSLKKLDQLKTPGSSKTWVNTVFRTKGYVRNGSGVDVDHDSQRGIVRSLTTSDLEMGSLGSEPESIRKRSDYDVHIEDVHNEGQETQRVGTERHV